MAGFESREATASKFTYQQTMLRIKDPKPTLEYYIKHFGMTLIDMKSFPDYKFDLYFLATMPDGAEVPQPGTKEANKNLWTFNRTVLELTHNHGTESDPAFSYASGNAEPHRGVLRGVDRRLTAWIQHAPVPLQHFGSATELAPYPRI